MSWILEIETYNVHEYITKLLNDKIIEKSKLKSEFRDLNDFGVHLAVETFGWSGSCGSSGQSGRGGAKSRASLGSASACA